MFQRHLGQKQRQSSRLTEDEIQGLPQLQRPRGIKHVGTRQAEVEVTGDVPGVLGDVGHERYYVVIGLSFYLVDTFDGEVRLLGQFLYLFGRDLPELRPRPADRKLHPEPGAILRLLGPHSPDLREGVALDHGLPTRPIPLTSRRVRDLRARGSGPRARRRWRRR